MVLRNVPSTATFEEQRVEINELAADVEALDAAALKAESDTLQTVTDRGFTTDNPIKIENNAATAFVVEDGSSNEKFVVDSVNGKVNVGSSAGGASGLYLFHNNSGATPAITLDGATGSITADGGSTFGGDLFVQDSSYLRVRATGDNTSTAVQLGPDGTGSFASGALSISNVGVTTVDIAGGNSGWAFYASNNDSRTGRPTYKATNKAGGELFGGTNADASANVFAIQSDGSATFAGEVNVGGYDGSSTTTDGVLLGAVGGVYSQLADGNPTGVLFQGMHGSTFTSRITAAGAASFEQGLSVGYGTSSASTVITRWRSDVVSANTTVASVNADGSASFASGTVSLAPNLGVTIDDGTIDLYQATSNTAAKPFKLQSDVGGTKVEKASITADGSAIFVGGVQAASVNLQSSSTNSWLQTGTSIASTNYVWAAKDSANNVWHSGLQTDGDLYLGGDLAGSNNIELSGSDGTGWFQNPSGDTTLSLGDLSNSNGRLVLTAKTSSLEIHSRSNHQINFLFNTVTKATLGIGGDLSLAGGITLTGQTNTTASGASASSDAFDHYEEGTWTPNFNGLSSAFNSYSNKFGTYVRIGSWCHIQGFIQLTGQPSFTDSNAYLMLGPLPFNYSNQNTGYNVTVGNVACQGFNWHDNDYSNTGQVAAGIGNDSGTSYVIFQVSGNDNVRGIVQNSAIGADDVIEFTLSYRV